MVCTERIAVAGLQFNSKSLTTNAQTYEPMAYQNYAASGGGGVLPKSHTWPKVQPKLPVTASRMGPRYETNDTDFEEDMSDDEEYSGRRSEDSVSRFPSLEYHLFKVRNLTKLGAVEL